MPGTQDTDLLSTFKQRLERMRTKLIAMDQRPANIESVVRATARDTDEILVEA